MIYKFTYYGELPSLNEYLSSERVHFKTRNGGFSTKGARMKKDCQKHIRSNIVRDLKNTKITKPIIIHYKFFNKDRRKDVGNIFSVADKFICDALQETGTIINDNQKYVKGFTSEFYVDSKNPRIEVELEECEVDK